MQFIWFTAVWVELPIISITVQCVIIQMTHTICFDNR